MKIVLYIGRALVAALGALLTYAAVKGVLITYGAAPWTDMAPLAAFFSQSLLISIPAIPFSLMVMMIWPRAWPLPLAALLWTIAATMVSDPQKFDFVFNWFLRVGSGS